MYSTHRAVYALLDDINRHVGEGKNYRITLLMFILSSQISSEKMDAILEAYSSILALEDEPLTGRAV